MYNNVEKEHLQNEIVEISDDDDDVSVSLTTPYQRPAQHIPIPYPIFN